MCVDSNSECLIQISHIHICTQLMKRYVYLLDVAYHDFMIVSSIISYLTFTYIYYNYIYYN